MKILLSIFSYKILLPIGLLLIILYSLQKVNNFIKIRGIMKEHIKIFGGSKIQILFFFGLPVLFATSFVQLCAFNQEAFNTLYVVITILLTMFFSILTVLAGYKNEDLRYFHDGNTIHPSKVVIVGARSLDQGEKENLKYAGITVFTTEDIKNRGVEAVMDEAFKIAGEKTKGIHISYDIDVIDPNYAPGVSVPEFDGINVEEAMKINEIIIKHIEEITSYDLVEFNPLRDIERKTEQIAVNLLAQIIAAADRKDKYGKIDLTSTQADTNKINTTN